MGLKSDKIKQSSVSDALRVAILRELEVLNGGIPGSGGATEVTLNAILALLTGTNLTLGSVEYTDAINHDTTAGKNTVMITCTDNLGSINGVVRPAGIYTYQPTGEDKNDVIVVNANNGKMIIDEL